MKPQHIGIVACTAEGAALCYRTICSEGPSLLGPHGHPEITMHTPPFAAYAKFLDADDWEGVADLMVSSAEKLARAGADFAICPDNTIHEAMPLVARRSPLPFLHIAQPVADEAAAKGYRKVGLTGTRSLVESSVYGEKLAAHGIGVLLPDDADRERMNRIIFEELVPGRFPASLSFFLDLIGRMKQSGCDAVVLGCTEIPLLVTPENSPLPVLDSTRLLARAALARSVEGHGSRD
jgi:aspartate racemase